jgi:hypothetical protein
MTHFDIFLAAIAGEATPDGILGDELVQFPTSESVDYWATPRKAVVFSWRGCDGVHSAILKINGQVSDSSPVIEISPMDAAPYSLLAPTFCDFLAIGCGVTREEMEQALQEEESRGGTLGDHLRSLFQQSRFWFGSVDRDVGPYRHLIESRE